MRNKEDFINLYNTNCCDFINDKSIFRIAYMNELKKFIDKISEDNEFNIPLIELVKEHKAVLLNEMIHDYGRESHSDIDEKRGLKYFYQFLESEVNSS